MCDHVALAQRAQGELLAHALAVLLVVHALCREGGRQLVERDLVALGDLLECAIQLFIGNGQADVLGALSLDLLKDQTLEHLLLEHALRGEFDLLFLETLGDRLHLLIELALQDDAVVDDGRNTVQQFAVYANVARLSAGPRHDEQRGNHESA